MASLPVSGTEFGQIIARATLKRALSEDELDTALGAAGILISGYTGIKHQEEGAEAFERDALIALAKALAQPGRGE